MCVFRICFHFIQIPFRSCLFGVSDPAFNMKTNPDLGKMINNLSHGFVSSLIWDLFASLGTRIMVPIEWGFLQIRIRIAPVLLRPFSVKCPKISIFQVHLGKWMTVQFLCCIFPHTGLERKVGRHFPKETLQKTRKTKKFQTPAKH
jgi:hypothetical protein